MKKNFLTAFFAILFVGVMPIFAQIPDSEKEALLALYKATDGANWEESFRWDTSKDPNKWSGVLVEDGHVILLNLSSAGLNGTIPEGIFSKLPNLGFLILDNNPNLRGQIPQDITSLSHLEGISLTYCSFTGKMPSLDGFSELKVVNFSMLNQKRDPEGFTATMPDFSKMPGMIMFDASFAGMTGHISEGIGDCSELLIFDISGNNIEGPLPASLNKCTKLADFSVQDNKLSGEIPDLSAITNITFNPKEGLYGRFFLNGNQFTGEFPQWLSNLNKVKRISLSNNKLEGSMPDDLSSLTEVEALFADNNNLSGNLPKTLPQSLLELNLSNNQFTGTIPLEWKNAKNINDLNLTNNELSGKVDLAYKALKELEKVRVSFNRFTFADFEGWDTFAKSKDTRFYFGLQKNYSDKKEVKVATGEAASLDASIPTPMPKTIKLTYKWYNTSTMEEVKGATNTPILELKNVNSTMAHGYICLVTTDYFGNDPTGELENTQSSLREEEENKEILTPMMASGKIQLYVDGKSTSLPQVEDDNTKPYVYPTSIESQLHIANSDEVESVWIFNKKGEKVKAERLSQGKSSLSIEELSAGNYFVLLLSHSGKSIVCPIYKK